MKRFTQQKAMACVALIAACSERPPLAPAHPPAAVRFEETGPARFRMLTLQTVVEQRQPKVRVATTQSEYRSLWGDYGLEGSPTSVDFQSELVVLFTEPAFCNDGKVADFTLTSSGEIIPSVVYSGRVCNLLATSRCPYVRVYVAALSRLYFTSGSYRVRNGNYVSELFGVTAATSQPLPVMPVLPPPAPEAPNDAVFHHPRRARVHFGPGNDETGVWVRDDAVWLPWWPDQLRESKLTDPEALCDEAGCVPSLLVTGCAPPECLTWGSLVIAQRPLRPRDPWPTTAQAWNQLVRDLRRDPVLAEVIEETVRYPAPASDSKPSVGWAANRFDKRVIETTAAADAGVFARSGAGYIGPSLRLGLRYTRPANLTGSDFDVREVAAGDSWGFDLRAFGMRQFESSGAHSLYGAGIALGANNVLGPSTSSSRLRTQSLIGLVMPEIGGVYQTGDRVRPYLSHGIPFTVLLTQQLALEARPTFTLRILPASMGGADALLSLSLGVMWRIPHSPCP